MNHYVGIQVHVKLHKRGSSANYRMLYIDFDVQYVAFNGFCHDNASKHMTTIVALPGVLSVRVRTCLG